MSANPIWIAGYFGPVAGAAPVWIAPGDGTVPSAVQSEIVSYYAPVAGATAVWIAGFFAPPPAAIGATPITISGWGGSGGGGGGGSTSVWSASDAAANGMTLSNGGLTVTPTVNAWQSIRGSVSKSSGKVYIELKSEVTSGDFQLGVANGGFSPSAWLGNNPQSASIGSVGVGGDYNAGAFTLNYSVSVVNGVPPGGVISIAIDFSVGSIWFGSNNTWVNSSDPATGTLPMYTFVPATVGALFPAMGFNNASSGVWTLQSTAASQKYAPPSGFSAWDSAAPSHSAEALAYLARTVGGNEGGNGANIATLIDGLVSDGVWAKLDALYVLAQQNQSDAQLNLVGTSYGLTGGLLAKPGPRALTFAPYVGFSGFANGLDSGFNPTTAVSPQYTLNSASLGYWAYSNIADDSPQVGIDNSSSEVYGHFTDGNAIISVNNSGFFRVASSITAGIIAGDRPDVANSYIYQNGIGGVSSGAASVSLYNGDFRIGLVTGGPPPTAQTISAAFIGASLGAAGQLALYNRLRTYMTAVGVP